MKKLTTLFVAVTFVFLVTGSALALYIEYQYSAEFDDYHTGLDSTFPSTGTATLIATADYPGTPSVSPQSDRTIADFPLTSVLLTLNGTDYDGTYTPSSLGVVELVNVHDTGANDVIGIVTGPFENISFSGSSHYFYPVFEMTAGFFWDTGTPNQQAFTTADITGYSSSVIEYSDLPGDLFAWYEDANASANVVPEPATVLLLGTGLVGLAGARLRKKFKK